jgi:hypothetical protein
MPETDQERLVLKIDVVDPVDHLTLADAFAIDQTVFFSAGIEEIRRCGRMFHGILLGSVHA